MCRLINQKLKDGTFVVAHTSVHKLVNEHAVVDLRLGDEEHALLLLSSLPDSWEILVISLNNSTPNGTFTMALVKDALFSKEAWRNEIVVDQSNAFVTEGKQHANGRGRNTNRKGAKVEEDYNIEKRCEEMFFIVEKTVTFKRIVGNGNANRVSLAISQQRSRAQPWLPFLEIVH